MLLFGTIMVVGVMGLRAPADAVVDSDAAVEMSEKIAEVGALAGDPPAAYNPDVTVPASGDRDITVESETGVGTMGIPATGQGVAAPDGTTTLFAGTAARSAVAVQTTPSGARAVIDIQSATAPESYRFELGGEIAKLALEDDGSVTTFDDDGEANGQVAAPWAYDAAGAPVPTHYVVSGLTLTQVVEHRDGDFVYGITADPRLTFGWGVYLNMRGWEVKALASVTYTSAAVSSMIACQARNLPSVLGRLFAIACNVVGGASLISIAKTLTSIARSRAVSDYSCYQTKIVPPNRELKRVSVSQCTD